MPSNKQIDFKKALQFGGVFCPAPFIEKMIDVTTPNRMCCRDRPSGLGHDVIRDRMLANKPSPDCAHCYEIESQGIVSLRQIKITDAKKKHAENLEHSVDQWIQHGSLPTARVFQITSSNVCNYACIMCTPGRSSALAKKMDFTSQIKQIDISDLQVPNGAEVALAGGEPFLIKDYLDLLERMPADVSLTISTNGSILNHKLVALLKKFDEFHLMISIDGVGEDYSKIRINGDWSTVEKNVDILAQNFNDICVVTTVQKDNVNQLRPIYEWSKSKGIAWRAHILTNPAHLHWKQQASVDTLQLQQINCPDPRTLSLLKSIIKENFTG